MKKIILFVTALSFLVTGFVALAQDNALPAVSGVELPDSGFTQDFGSQGLSEGKCSVNGKEAPCEEALQQLKTFAGIGFGIIALIGGVILVGSIFWLLMLIHAISKPIENKAIWIFILLFTSVVGALVYFFVVKRKFGKNVVATT